MEKITYPDGEEISYGYDYGGNVSSVKGKNRGIDFTYVDKAGYNEFGQRAYLKLGNGKELLSDKTLYNEKGAGSGGDVIRAALEKLGVDTSNINIRVGSSSPDKKATPGAFATIRGVGTRNVTGSDSGHYQEGDAKGNFKWDAIDGAKDTGRKVGAIRSVFIDTKPPQD